MNNAVSLVCAFALATLSAPAFAALAQGHQGFVRAELGNTDFETSIRGGGPTISEDSDTRGFGGGYWFNANVGVEGNYVYLYNRALRNGGELEVYSIGAGLVAKKNFGADGNGFYLGGRAGIAYVDEHGSADDGSAQPYYGVNLGYDFNRNVGLGLNYTHHHGEFDFVDIDADVLSISGEYRF